MAEIFSYTPVYPLSVKSAPSLHGRKMPDPEGISQQRTVGLNQDLKVYSLRFIEKNVNADALDNFLKDRDRFNEWFYWTPPNESTKAFRCSQWRKSRRNCVWSEISAEFKQVIVPGSIDVCLCPSIKGTPTEGKILSIGTIQCGSQIGTLKTVQWLREGEIIPGETSPDYLVQGVDIGFDISASVTYTTPKGQIAGCITTPVTIQQTPDPYYANVSMLLHFDGTFVDTSPLKREILNYLNAEPDFTNKKFGTASIKYDPSIPKQQLYSMVNAGFDIYLQDFTLEIWAYFTNVNTNQALMGKSAAGDFQDEIQFSWMTDNGGHFRFATSPSNYNVKYKDFFVVPTLNTWHHIALVRKSSTLKFFLDGIQIGNAEPFDISVNSYTARVFRVGVLDDSDNWRFAGNLDELRITVGVARYWANFPVPTKPFPDS